LSTSRLDFDVIMPHRSVIFGHFEKNILRLGAIAGKVLIIIAFIASKKLTFR